MRLGHQFGGFVSIMRRVASLAIVASIAAGGVVVATSTSAGAATPTVLYPCCSGPVPLPQATVGHAYSVQLVTVGNVPAQYQLAINSLPLGLSVSRTGLISGTPTLPEASNFALNVTEKPPAQSYTGPFLTLTVSSGYPFLDPTLVPFGTNLTSGTALTLGDFDLIGTLLRLVDQLNIAPLTVLFDDIYTVIVGFPPPPPQDSPPPGL
jgi:hypothetical protein